MMKTYKNPPLVEAVCEFRFVLNNDFPKEQINLFYEKIKNDFPIEKKRKLHQLEVKIEAEKTPEENKENINQGFYEFEQYLSEDEKYSIQLDKSKVSIHRIKPYTSWADFFPLIQNTYKAYIEIFNPTKVERIGIRYVNEVVIPLEDFSFKEYFNVVASLPSLEQNQQKSIFIGSVFEQENGQDAIKVQFAEKQLKEYKETRAFILDFDYFLTSSELPFDKIDKWLEKAHSNLEGVFEGMVTERTRKLFDNKQ